MTLVYISAHGADHIAASGGESNPTEIEKDEDKKSLEQIGKELGF